MEISRLVTGLVLLGSCLLGFAAEDTARQAPQKAAPSTVAATNAPPTNRAQLAAAIDRGLRWLLQSQNPVGWWSTAEQPAVTGLVLAAFNGQPTGRDRARSSELNRAYEFILESARDNGSIHRGFLINYNTSLSLLALATANEPRYLPVIQRARAYLASTQIDEGKKGIADTPWDGGVGYGSKYQHSDMNNTLTALEAMRWSERQLSKDAVAAGSTEPDLNWAAVVQFLQGCQNLPSHNSADWVSDRPADHGGFVYYPGQSMAGGVTNVATGKVSLRSYGSISYAGLLSYIYAKVDREDARVKAVLEWLKRNYTLDENPGMNQQGYFYYLHLMTKALIAARVESLPLTDGRVVDWRNEVARRLLALQKPDGSWVNPEKRWWESDPNLVTAYAVMTLEMLHATIPE